MKTHLTHRVCILFAAVALAIWSITSGTSVRAASLEALWGFDETSGTTAFDETNAIGLVLGGNSLPPGQGVVGQFGYAYDFGTDPNARAEGTSAASQAVTNQTGDFTILTWINPTAGDFTGPNVRFIDTSGVNGAIDAGYRLFTDSGANSDNFRFLGVGTGGNTSIIHSRDLTAGQWTLLAIRYDTDGTATSNVLYSTDSVNSAFIGTNAQSTAATGPITYGPGESANFGTTDSPTAPQSFNGLMDQTAFFKGVLTDRQLSNAFNLGAENTFGLALANYDFESDGSGSSVAGVSTTPVTVSGTTSSFGGAVGDNTGRDASGRVLGTTSDLGSLGVSRIGGVLGNSLADAITAEDYLSLTISPDGSNTLDLESFMFKAALRSNNSPEHWALFSDIDGFDVSDVIDQGTITTLLVDGSSTAVPGPFEPFVIDLTASTFQGLSESVEFRLYLWGDSMTGTNSLTRFDKFTINGQVVVPEPGSITLFAVAGLMGLGLTLLRRRR